jgi:hypothetical protein
MFDTGIQYGTVSLVLRFASFVWERGQSEIVLKDFLRGVLLFNIDIETCQLLERNAVVSACRASSSPISIS